MDRWTDEWHRLPLFVASRSLASSALQCSNVFFVFASVGFQSFSGHYVTTDDLTNVSGGNNAALVGRLAKSPPCLHAFPSSMIGLLYIEGNERIARGGLGGVASGPRYRHDDGVIITLAFRRHS